MASIKARLLRGSLWVSIARAVSNALNALSTIVLARLLLPADFGLVAFATSMLVVSQAFTELSLTQALIHTKDPTPDHYNTVWSLSLLRGLVFGLAFAAAGPLAAYAFADPDLQGVMIALGFSAILGGLANPKITLLTKQLKFHQEALLSTAHSLTNVIVAILVAALTQSYWALVAGVLAGQSVKVALSYLLLPYRPAISLSKFREMWGFSLWLSLSQIVATLNYRFDELLVGSVLGRRDLGLYTVGGRLAKLPGREIVQPLTVTLFPAFRLAADDPERLKRAYVRTQGITTALALPTGIGFALLADPIVRLALGNNWTGAILVVQLIAMVTSLETLGTLVTPLGMAKGQTRLLFLRNCQKLAMRVPMILIGLIAGGLFGLLIMRAAAGLLSVIIDMALISRLVNISMINQLRANQRCLLATSAMAVGVFYAERLIPEDLQHFELALLLGVIVVAGALIYGAVSLLLWRVSGRPDGAESEVIATGRSLLKTLGERRAKRSL